MSSRRQLAKLLRQLQQVLAAWWILCGLSHSVTAEDRVTFRSASAGARISQFGTVVDYTGRELILQSRDRTDVRRMPSDDVLEISTNYLPAHADGRQRLAAGEPAAARELLERALEEESRDWVRREILALLVQCALATGDQITAGERFLQITNSDPETLYFSLAPLCWSESPVSPALAARGLTWLQSKKEIPRLLGASVLLYRRPFDEQAQTTLRDLASSGNPVLQRHAQLQLWRLRVGKPEVDSQELGRWERLLDDLPRAARTGAFTLIAAGYEKVGDPAHALACYLRAGLDSAGQRTLARAALEAALRIARETADRRSEAVIATELQTRFAASVIP